MSNERHTYLESGTLIDIGTLLKVWDDTHSHSSLYEITTVYKGKYGASVEVTPIKHDDVRLAIEAEGFSISDLEDLRNRRLLTVYNRD